MGLKIMTNKKKENGLTITQLDNLIFLMYRSEYRSYFPFAYRDDNRFVGYAGSLCSTDFNDDSFDYDFPKVDIYICPNGMKSPFKRTSDQLVNIQNLVIDIDSHNSDLSIKEQQKHIKAFAKKLMKILNIKPNFLSYTGRGLHLWYCITPCHVSLEKICLSVIDMLCKEIEAKMLELNETELTVDRSASLKLNGLIRVPYTYNSKSQTWGDGDLIHEDLPNINELKEELYKLGHESAYFGEIKKKSKKKKEIKLQRDLEGKDYTPCLIKRKHFLEHLIETRPKQEKSRDLLTFAMYQTISSLYEKEYAQQYCLDINNNFYEPLKHSEMLSIFKEVDKKKHKFTVKGLFDFVNATQEERKWFYQNKGKSTKYEKTKEEKRRKKQERNNLVLELYEQEVPIAKICKLTGIKSRTTIYKIIREA